MARWSQWVKNVVIRREALEPDDLVAVVTDDPSGAAISYEDLAAQLAEDDTVADHLVRLSTEDRVDGEVPVWDADGQVWVSGPGGDGDLKAENNLSDLDDAEAARTNLGLGDAATHDVGTTESTVAAGDAPAGAVSTHAGGTEVHAISAVTGLQSALDAKQAIVGSVVWAPPYDDGFVARSSLGVASGQPVVWPNPVNDATPSDAEVGDFVLRYVGVVE